MIAGRWRKRDHRLLGTNLDDVRNRLLESGQRLIATMPGATGAHS
jgi:hypothetical protein